MQQAGPKATSCSLRDQIVIEFKNMISHLLTTHQNLQILAINVYESEQVDLLQDASHILTHHDLKNICKMAFCDECYPFRFSQVIC